ARVERAVDDADAVVVVGIAPGAEHHRAEAERGDLCASGSKRAVVHGLDLSGRVRESCVHREWSLVDAGQGRRNRGVALPHEVPRTPPGAATDRSNAAGLADGATGHGARAAASYIEIA